MNINPGAISNCYQTMYSMIDQDVAAASSFSLEPNSSSSGAVLLPQDQNHSTSLLYSLSVLKEKVHQAKSLVGVLIAPPDHHLQSQHHHQPTKESSRSSTMDAVESMNNVIQEIIVTASSMMFTCQQMENVAPGNHTRSELNFDTRNCGRSNSISDAAFYSTHDQPLDDWFSNENYSNDVLTRDVISRSHRQVEAKDMPLRVETKAQNLPQKNSSYNIIELDAADLLAKYTHYCQVCGKGFERDANLRMHMRAHGDIYKTTVALRNPLKRKITSSEVNIHGSSNNAECSIMLPRKYSCPQEGCRWNQKHVKFQPLKSMICVKNHYKRSHCPKMYICKRCNRKQFSVLSDLRTHEKHCGDLRWECSCGTTFSRKEKLMGHVDLFVGHTPAMIMSSTMPIRNGKAARQVVID